MNFTTITRLTAKTIWKAKYNSPRIMFVAGLVGVTAGAVMASRATLRLDETVSKSVKKLDDIAVAEKDPAMDYYRNDAARDRAVIYGEMTVKIVQLYGPSIIVGAVGIACLTGSHNILMKRNSALTAAYVALDRSYSAYRDRVRDAIGSDEEEKLHYDASKALAVQERELGATGEKMPRDRSQYARWFNHETTKEWNYTSREKNLFFVSCQERWANEKLHRRGYLFLNEVYESLGFALTEAGCVVGWIMNGDGDKFVDFGIFNHHTNEVKYFLGGINEEILLDFNVDGLVSDKLAGG